MLDVHRLRILLAVVESGSVTAAAEQLGYSPSAVSQQLRRLEREAGQPLLQRHWQPRHHRHALAQDAPPGLGKGPRRQPPATPAL